ncbi:putative alpha-1,2-mannosidase [Chryseobacterium sp. SORGH_AS909]|uniref:Alpha-1,2-mannosidase n=2 Tax=Chryseobacterium group TaxID=2782232 RepID=A0ABU0TDN6_9FLAO|nr:putative alpha-1,2-mannosidase [Chryseobacterium camelliae]MDQ1099120.1 putative alpha-1,2-mannosidase [Chryseobacterium sp. SORGH_AS_1048]MDR6086469.1 putative alpha-1,2-mannosidase [Chryseobacterium sp. SORGH_AS_0909]MDR6130841.1 putative alpha-1,2-mannosidase [Chryseobacterium sp. SORGH_AS_1175]MDT3407026.1 putative alpha-1,2-mannosidase [Pseudacidovorax intermedius]
MVRMKKILFVLLGVISAHAFSQNYAQYVNPFIGTGGHGHTFPGAIVPFGMVQLSPDTRIDGSWDGCSGYHYSDSVIYGFSHTHLNGTGVSDYGDIMLMPTMGKASLNSKEYSSLFSHKNEKATAGFYSVKLNKNNIDVRLTTTKRVGYHEYTFNNAGTANIILDLNHRDKLLEGEVRIIDPKTVEVFRRSSAWATDQYIYARIEFSKPVEISRKEVNGTQDRNVYTGTRLALAFSAKVKKGEKINVKVAISPTGYEGAGKNMLAEGKSNDFESIRKMAAADWDKELSKIEVKSADKNKLTIFYTALYHVFTQPNINMDTDGKYRGRDNKFYMAKGFDYYTVFSLWDTFRGAHPLMTLIDRKRTSDFINTFIKQYEQGGKLPVWELASNETECMIGYHAVSVIADAMAKGIKGFDYEKAFEASKHSAMLDIFGLNAYKQNNYISIDDEHESVSKTVEYAYDDWCIAQMAKILGKKEDYQYFMKRSQNWKNLYNPENGFMQPRKNGNWYQPFDPREVNNNYTEGNSWHYSYSVQQDIPGLIAAHGGKEKFEQFIDAIFAAPDKTTGREQVDITGLIGQYAQGNEPSHHIAYLYNYVGKPEKTDEKIKYILDHFYKNAPDGLIGNEDCGQMSAWYILSTLGIYAVTPGLPEWQTTKPYFDEIKIHLEDGTTRTITPNTGRDELRKLGFENVRAFKDLKYDELTASPVIAADRLFDFSTKVTITPLNPEDKLYYMTLDEGDANVRKTFKAYKEPFTINTTTMVSAYAERNGEKSSITTANFNRRPNHWDITVNATMNPQYTAGGKLALIDGIHGDINWRKGEWQGYQGQNFEAIIDFKSPQDMTRLSSTYLQDSRAWILMPKKVEYYASMNGKDYILLSTVNNTVDPKDETVQVKEFSADILPTQARYLKVKAYYYGKLPEWHQGAGGEAYIFLDEISVK